MRRSALFFVVLAFSLVCSPIFSQSTNATITGTVNDSGSHLIPAADLEIVNDATGVHYAARTNRDGIYNLSILPPGTYTVQASKIGFKTIITPNVTLNLQGVVALNFVLPIGATSETVTVEAGSILLNTTDASVSTVVSREFIANMPLNGRSLQSLISLTPGVVQTPLQYGSTAGSSGEFSINGQRTEANYYNLDGVSANVGVGTSASYTAGAGGLVPNQTALGTTQSLASLDALQEFRISTSTYSAEFGRTPGGQLSLQTRSGGNVVHGNLFDYFRNDALDANNWFNDHTTPQTRKTAERQNDFGGTVGGPIWLPKIYNGHDRSFFFYSYEGLRLTVPTPVTTVQVPDTNLRNTTAAALQPFITAFPKPNGGAVAGVTSLAYFTGSYSLPAVLNTHSLRLDHVIIPSIRIFGHYSNAVSSSKTRSQYNLASITTSEYITRSLTSGITQSFGSHSVNDARYNYTWTQTGTSAVNDSFGGAAPATISTFLASAPKYANSTFLLNWGSLPRVGLSVTAYGQTQVNFVDKLTIQARRHVLKLGFDYRRLELNNGVNQFVAALNYASPSQLQNNTTAGYTQTSGRTPSAVLFHNFSAFLQDDWKVGPRISLSTGVRWDINPSPTNANGRIPPTLDQITNLATAQLMPEGTRLWNTYYRGIAPRIGLAVQLNNAKGRETVFRSGFGVFYDTGNTLGAMGFSLLGIGARQTYTGITFPLPASFYTIPTPTTTAPYNSSFVAFDRNLKLPYTYQWNVSVEQALGTSRSFTLGYVASAGRDLLWARYLTPTAAVNPAYSSGYGLYTVTNSSWSNYQSLQAQFQQRVSRGLQVLAAMTWSHNIDNLSSSFVSSTPLLKADSDFDIRSNSQLALTYVVPSPAGKSAFSILGRDWAFDLRAFSRTAQPIDVYGSNYIAADGTQQSARPNLVSNTPRYIYGDRSAIPGGRKINFAAFQSVTGAIGNAPRNFLRGFGSNEIDFALRREFIFREGYSLQFRAEAFNILNHPNFGAIYNTLSTGATQFGQAYNTLNVGLKNQNALYQQGGPRSLQLALKFLF